MTLPTPYLWQREVYAAWTGECLAGSACLVGNQSSSSEAIRWRVHPVPSAVPALHQRRLHEHRRLVVLLLLQPAIRATIFTIGEAADNPAAVARPDAPILTVADGAALADVLTPVLTIAVASRAIPTALDVDSSRYRPVCGPQRLQDWHEVWRGRVRRYHDLVDTRRWRLRRHSPALPAALPRCWRLPQLHARQF